MFGPYLERWRLEPDGEPITTANSRLLPVRHHGEPAMLKIAVEPDERFGGLLMGWWDGEGAARLLAQDDRALLLERATGPRSLAAMARTGRDDEATRILCRAVGRLHAVRRPPPPDLIPLDRWFRELLDCQAYPDPILARSAAMAKALLASPRDAVVLHGDLHHDNILDFGPRGWLAIDPKRITGERGFDYANIFCNPDQAVAADPARFARRLDIVVEEAGLDRRRLLQWILAWAGLSAVWWLGDGVAPELDLAIARLTEAELERMRGA